MNNGKTPERDAAFEKYVLQQLRCARRRIQLLVNEIDTIGVALRSGAISSEDALLALHQAGSLNFLWASPPSPVNWEDLNEQALVGDGVGADRASAADQGIGNAGAQDGGKNAR